MKAPEWIHEAIRAKFRKPWDAVCRWHQRKTAGQKVKDHFERTRQAIELEIVRKKIECTLRDMPYYPDGIRSEDLPPFEYSIDTTGLQSMIQADKSDSARSIRS